MRRVINQTEYIAPDSILCIDRIGLSQEKGQTNGMSDTYIISIDWRYLLEWFLPKCALTVREIHQIREAAGNTSRLAHAQSSDMTTEILTNE